MVKRRYLNFTLLVLVGVFTYLAYVYIATLRYRARLSSLEHRYDTVFIDLVDGGYGFRLSDSDEFSREAVVNALRTPTLVPSRMLPDVYLYFGKAKEIADLPAIKNCVLASFVEDELTKEKLELVRSKFPNCGDFIFYSISTLPEDIKSYSQIDTHLTVRIISDELRRDTLDFGKLHIY